jgi:hypothetical protein
MPVRNPSGDGMLSDNVILYFWMLADADFHRMKSLRVAEEARYHYPLFVSGLAQSRHKQ